MQVEREAILAALVTATMNSFALDFVARQCVGGTHLNFFILKQLPIPPPSAFSAQPHWAGGNSIAAWMLPRILELTYTAVDMEGFANDLSYDGPPFVWDEERRFWLRAELDAAFFHLYGINRDDVDYIMETFPIVKRKDVAAHGTYRTKEAILSIYDDMAEVSKSGGTFQTKLNPPSANGWVPPPLPLPEDLVQMDSLETKEKPVGTRSVTPKGSASTAPEPKMANLFEEAPKTLFDETEEDDEQEEPEAPAELAVIGAVLVNSKPAQLIGKKARPNGVTEFQVILDETGEVKKYLSPPARVEMQS